MPADVVDAVEGVDREVAPVVLAAGAEEGIEVTMGERPHVIRPNAELLPAPVDTVVVGAGADVDTGRWRAGAPHVAPIEKGDADGFRLEVVLDEAFPTASVATVCAAPVEPPLHHDASPASPPRAPPETDTWLLPEAAPMPAEAGVPINPPIG